MVNIAHSYLAKFANSSLAVTLLLVKIKRVRKKYVYGTIKM